MTAILDQREELWHGELELVPLQTLRERVKSAGVLPGRLKLGVVRGDVRQMHQSPENAGALFQLASEFNLLEMAPPRVAPEHGATGYKDDHTQGPARAIAAGAATIYRSYLAPVGRRPWPDDGASSTDWPNSAKP